MRFKRVMRNAAVLLVLLLALGLAPMSVSAAPGTPAAVVGAPQGVYMRQAPSLSAAVVRTLYNGQTVYILSGPTWNQGISWSYVRVYHGAWYSQGYCASAYLSTYGGYVPTGEHGLMVTVPNGLRLRSGPGIWYATRRIVPYGTVVQPTGVSQWGGGILWTKVAFNGSEMWAAAMYLVAV